MLTVQNGPTKRGNEAVVRTAKKVREAAPKVRTQVKLLLIVLLETHNP